MKKIQKFISICLTAVLLMCVPIQTYAYEQEDTGNTETAVEAQNEAVEEIEEAIPDEAQDASENSATNLMQEEGVGAAKTEDPSAIEYIYLDYQELAVGKTQNIVVALSNPDAAIAHARLVLTNAAEEELVIEESVTVANTVLFTKVFDEEAEFSLSSFEYKEKESEVWTSVALSDVQKTSFSVTKAEQSEPEAEITAYAMDEKGEIVETSGDSVEEVVEDVLDTAGVETGIEAVAAAGMLGSRAADTRTDDLVVALDPGHDSHCGGAHANGLAEEVLTLKVANYCKEELETYEGVKVIMTRTGAACPNPLPGSYNSAKDIRQRVQKAVQQGADVIVSFHFNSSPSGSANGAEVIYQNNSYDASVGLESKELADKIQKQLTALGLKDRGTYSKDSTDGSHDPNGVKDDYFALHNEAKALSTPAVLIEHAFLTGNVDAANLKSEAYLKKMGVADATGIAEKYGLFKIGTNVTPEVKTMIAERTGQTTFDVILKDIEGKGAISGIQVAVWSEKDGQDDMKWYMAKEQADGSYRFTVNTKDHKNNTGNYLAHAYVIPKRGNQFLANSAAVVMDQIKIGAKVKITNTSNGQFTVIVSDVKIPATVAEIQIPIWSNENGQDDIIWYTAAKQNDGTYKAVIDIKKHGYTTGLYNVHTYAVSTNGTKYLLNTNTITVELPKVSVTAEDSSNGAQEKFTLKATNISTYQNVSGVIYAVWSVKDGQDDLAWYDAKQNASGVWQTEINAAAHKSTGIFEVHAYVQFKDGSMKLVGNTEFKREVKEEEKLSVGKITAERTGDGKFRVQISDVKGLNNISHFVCPVWSDAGGQDDIIWYTMNKQNATTFTVDVDIANHNYSTGVYNAHVYAVDKAEKMSFATATTTKAELPNVNVTAKDTDGTQKVFELTASNVGVYGKVQSVRFAVWSDKNGQDDLNWYYAQQNQNGVWKIAVDATKHKSTGNYEVHTYAVLENGIDKLIGNTTFKVDEPEPPKAESVTIDKKNLDKGKFDVIIKGAKGTAGVREVYVPVWSQVNGQDDLVWYYAAKQADGTYKVTVDIAKHHYDTGLYSVHTYVTDNTGVQGLVDAKTVSVELPKVSVKAEAENEAGNLFSIQLANVGVYGKLQEVVVAVWSDDNGQNDMKWYNAHQLDSGIWIAELDVNDHDVSGKYEVHAYVRLADGTLKLVGNTSFTGKIVYYIMGEKSFTVDQMVKTYKNHAKSYPAEALGKGGASTIEEFCKIIESEALAEGVKPEVVFAQAMVETGWLKFGGDVKIEQFNFCGLGATGNGATGNSFSDVRTGIRAQVQHLKCYASDQPLNQECVDPRWGEWLRNRAQTVEELGGKWAADKQYGNKLLKVIDEMKNVK